MKSLQSSESKDILTALMNEGSKVQVLNKSIETQYASQSALACVRDILFSIVSFSTLSQLVEAEKEASQMAVEAPTLTLILVPIYFLQLVVPLCSETSLEKEHEETTLLVIPSGMRYLLSSVTWPQLQVNLQIGLLKPVSTVLLRGFPFRRLQPTARQTGSLGVGSSTSDSVSCVGLQTTRKTAMKINAVFIIATKYLIFAVGDDLRPFNKVKNGEKFENGRTVIDRALISQNFQKISFGLQYHFSQTLVIQLKLISDNFLFRREVIVAGSCDNLRVYAAEEIENWILSWVQRKLYEKRVEEEKEQIFKVLGANQMEEYVKIIQVKQLLF